MSEVNWRAYAEVYDLMAANNPAYQELLAQLRTTVSGWQFPPGSVLADVGAGTGNFSLDLAAAFPDCRVIHLDSNTGMNLLAAEKAQARGLRNIDFLDRDIQAAPFAAGSLAAVTAVHTLYTFPRPREVIAAMFSWLQPGGRLLACDVGRIVNVRDWASFLFRESLQRQGLWRTLTFFYRGRVISRQNRLIARAQRTGEFWTHDLAEFKAVIEAAGFEILSAGLAYRGYSDLVAGRRPVR